MRWKLAFAALVCSCSTTLASPPSAAFVACEKQAAYMWEPGFRETGVAWDAVDVEPALEACRAALAETPDDAKVLYRLARTLLQDGQSAEGMELMERAASANYPPAAAAFGTSYFVGKDGVAQDMSIAFTWLMAAANDGNPVAQNNLAILLSSTGQPEDVETIIALYERASDQGYPEASRNLARHYHYGLGVPANLEQAIALYETAVEQGSSDALIDLAKINLDGIGIPRNPAKALTLTQDAYDLGNPAAARSLAYFYSTGTALAPDKARAAALYAESAHAGDAEAMYQLGLAYMYGRGLPQDQELAIDWLEPASQHSIVGASEALARIFTNAANPLHDPEEGRYWTEVAAAQGSMSSALMLAQWNYFGGLLDEAEPYLDYVVAYGDDDERAQAELLLGNIARERELDAGEPSP